MGIPEYVSNVEKKIATKIVTDALAAGYAVSVFDGEAYAVQFSKDREIILSGMASTGEDLLSFHTGEGQRHGKSSGSVYLVWGNDCDLIADHTDNEAMRTLLAGAEALAESLET
jgi:hypothetical protein